MVRHFKADPLSWGGSHLRNADENRKTYIAALVSADNRDFRSLLEFGRSKG